MTAEERRKKNYCRYCPRRTKAYQRVLDEAYADLFKVSDKKPEEMSFTPAEFADPAKFSIKFCRIIRQLLRLD